MDLYLIIGGVVFFIFLIFLGKSESPDETLKRMQAESRARTKKAAEDIARKKKAAAEARSRKEKVAAGARKKKLERQKESLIDKYGKEDGMIIFNQEISESEYLRKKNLIKKYGIASGDKIFNKELSLDMTEEMLIDSLGNPLDKKEAVTRTKVTKKYYFNSRETRQGTTVYGLEVTLENDVVSGWRELE